MIYPENFEEKIGFDLIRNMLSESCISDLGRNNIGDMAFSPDHEHVTHLLLLTSEFRDIITSSRAFPDPEYFDLTPELARISVKGTYIYPDQLHDLRLSLRNLYKILAYFDKAENRSDFPAMAEMCLEHEIESSILTRIDGILDEKGEILDKASQELLSIRKEIQAKIRQNEKVIGQILLKAKSSGWVREDAEITIRQGRLLIPVNASDKRKLRGFIHDESATGQTVYIEPAENFDLNNAIRDLENAEKREIIRILSDLTDFIRPHIDQLKEAFLLLGRIDFIRAKAKLAIKINATKPFLVDKPHVDWKEARHPLLFLGHTQKGLEVVPLDIRLNDPERILIISGPNAGGKSVCLKTTGLLQYMLQCGLLVPLREDSTMGMFSDLFVEIGDEQSIDNDLSTYSSHLIHVREILKNAGKGSLFLLDEFGAGTDPQLGGALAEATLEILEVSGAIGVVTTHYSNLKLLADRYESIVNGAMLFDTEKMQPLYRLQIGKPGSSFAFEIAGKIGLPSELIDKAARKTGNTQLDFEKQLQELESEKASLRDREKEFKVADDLLDELVDKYETMISDLQSSKNRIMEQARKEAELKIKEANRVIERTIKEIRESQAEKERTKQARNRLEKERKKLQTQKPEPEKKEQKKLPVIREGGWALIKGQDAVGRIIRVKGRNVTLDIRDVHLQTTIDKIEPSEPPRSEPKKGRTGRSAGIKGYNERYADFKLSIDLRGKKVEEALPQLERYIDDAILFNVSEVSILHGKGEGILRKVIRDYLRTVAQIASFQDEHVERGGAGITIVRFRG